MRSTHPLSLSSSHFLSLSSFSLLARFGKVLIVNRVPHLILAVVDVVVVVCCYIYSPL